MGLPRDVIYGKVLKTQQQEIKKEYDTAVGNGEGKTGLSYGNGSGNDNDLPADVLALRNALNANKGSDVFK